MIRRWDRHLYVKTKEVDKGSTVHRMAINQDLAPNWKVKRLKDTSLTTAHCHQNAYSTRTPPQPVPP